MPVEPVSRLKALVDAVGGEVAEEYAGLVRQSHENARVSLQAGAFRAKAVLLADRLMARLKTAEEAALRLIAEVGTEASGQETGSRDVGSNAKTDAEARAGAAGQSKRRKMKMTRKAGAKPSPNAGSAKQTSARKLQGTYIGLLRHSTKAEQAKAKSLAKRESVAAAVDYLARCRMRRGEPLPPSLLRKANGPKQAPGKKNSGKGGSAPNSAPVELQLELLKIASEHGGKVPIPELDKFVSRRGLRSRAQAGALFAHTQGKLRPKFVERAMAGLSTKDGVKRLRELARHFGTTPEALLAEAVSS